jgi:hypothetical protein
VSVSHLTRFAPRSERLCALCGKLLCRAARGNLTFVKTLGLDGYTSTEARMTDRKASFAKRQRELEQKERAAQRLQRKSDRKARAAASAANPDPNADPDIDPDLVGIVAGPQPRPDDDVPADVLDGGDDAVPSDDSASPS